MITNLYVITCANDDTEQILGAVAVNAVERACAERVAELLIADQQNLPGGAVRACACEIVAAGVIGNPGEDFRERARLEKLARRAARKFARMNAKEKAVVLPAILRQHCPGQTLAMLVAPLAFVSQVGSGITTTSRRPLKKKLRAKRGEIIPDFITANIARNGDVAKSASGPDRGRR